MNVELLEMQSTASAPVVVVTGEGDQGQNTVAMFWIEAALEKGEDVFHNGCSNEGSHITESALSQEERLADLMRKVPKGSTFVLADADCVQAVGDATEKVSLGWFAAADEMGHRVILTTVRGREYRLGAVVTDAGLGHMDVEAAPHLSGVFATWASGVLRERMPMARTFSNNDTMLRWAKLTNGLYQTPPRPRTELITTWPEALVVLADRAEAVRSTETPRPKHPANSFLLTRIAKQDSNHQMRITELLGLIWLESVNKRTDEEMAVRVIEWACQKWGIALDDVNLNPKTTYPDGWADTTHGPVNIEVTKVQPRWPSGATLSELVAGTRAGEEAVPSLTPVVKCKQCGTFEVSGITNVHDLPEHDESHLWTCTYPKSMVGLDWPDNLTALPELRIGPEQFRASIERAVREKTERAILNGRGQQNWLVLIIEGFPFTDWINVELQKMNWQSLDAVFAIMSDEFGSAIHGLYPDDHRKITVLKCPERDDRICYHPGFVITIRKDDGSMDALRDQGQFRGVTWQITADDGTILAEYEVEPPQPVSHQDVEKGFRAAVKSLPYELLTNQRAI